MSTIQAQAIKPVGLGKFLVEHGKCGEDFETQRDRGVVTVICRGCDASFSYLTAEETADDPDVNAALAALANGTNGASEPNGNGAAEANGSSDGNGSASAGNRFTGFRRLAPPSGFRRQTAPSPPPKRVPQGPASATAAPAPPPAPVEASNGQNGSATRLPPPGPYAPRRERQRSLVELFGPPLERLRHGAAKVLSGARRRPIILAALALAGAYIFIALSLGGQPSSSQSTRSLGGSDVPLAPPPPAEPANPSGSDQGPIASDARPLESFEAGGPGVDDVSVPAARFQVAMPPDWQQSTGTDGRTLLRPESGGGEIQVLTRPRANLGIGQIADEAAAFLALGIPPGARVERLPSQPQGNLMAVAKTVGGTESKTAYIAVSGPTSYLVIRVLSSGAPALVGLQADGIASSFEPQPAG